jgi:EmrB/QacA subfamily drug resistance transporter
MEVTVDTLTPTQVRSRRLALAVLCAGALMVILDQTVVNVALPAVQADLGFSASSLAWVVNAYVIAFAGLLLLAGRLGDLFGARRVFLFGLALFTAASVWCGVSSGPAMLVAARFVQGAGGAAASAVILGMIVTLFPQPRDRAKAIGAFSFVQAAGGSLGSLAGGVITQAVSWHWIFFVNVPIGLAAMGLAVRLLERDPRADRRRGADLSGALLVTTALMVGVYAVVEVADFGWASAHTLGFGALSLLLLAAFLVRQGKAAEPLLPLGTFRSRTVSGVNLVQILLIGAMFGFQFLAVLYLRQVLGLDASETGLSMVPIAVVIAAVSLGMSARLNVRFGELAVLLSGLGLIVVSFGWLTFLPARGAFAADFLPASLLIGLGFGLAMPALMGLGMSGTKADEAGLVSGLFTTSQQVGGALGLAALAVLAATRTTSLSATGEDRPSALTGGYHLAFATSAVLVLLAAGIAVAILRNPRTARS